MNEKLKNLNLTIQTVYKTGVKEEKDQLEGVLYDVTPMSGTAINVATTTSVPGMREFKAERVHGVATDAVQTIAPRTHEATLDVKREEIEDDNIGRIPAQVKLMARNAKRYYGGLATQALALGFTAKLSDGKAVFHADRGNLVTGALSETTFEKAYDALLSMKDDNGDPIGAIPKTLIVGVANRAVAKKILKAQNKANGESNINYEAVELIVDARIPDTTWALVGDSILPITIAERVKIGAPVAKNDLNSDRAFETDVFSWGVRGRFDAAFADIKQIVAGQGK
jgi:phage major head subunit gpT-like protein